jgi:hypothetical protein
MCIFMQLERQSQALSSLQPQPTPTPRKAKQGRRQPVDRTPDKAEGDERTKNEAIKRKEDRGRTQR